MSTTGKIILLCVLGLGLSLYCELWIVFIPTLMIMGLAFMSGLCSMNHDASDREDTVEHADLIVGYCNGRQVNDQPNLN